MLFLAKGKAWMMQRHFIKFTAVSMLFLGLRLHRLAHRLGTGICGLFHRINAHSRAWIPLRLAARYPIAELHELRVFLY